MEKLQKKNRLPENPDNREKEGAVPLGRFPQWLHRSMPQGGKLAETHQILGKHRLNTVCEEAKCPNRFECYSNHTATFLALGKECTRACGFCDIDFSKTPKAPEADEPLRIALSAKDLGLKHIVITMVARDDLPDQGSGHIAAIIRAVREHIPECTVEVLTSDLSGDAKALDTILNENPEVFNHNIETVRRLTPRVRHKASYEKTLSVLQYAKQKGLECLIKSGLMVGLGEEEEEVFETLRELHQIGCDIVTIGHYLQPNFRKLAVKAFITPEQFKRYETYGKELGIKNMYSGPFVRSSYNAGLFVRRK